MSDLFAKLLGEQQVVNKAAEPAAPPQPIAVYPAIDQPIDPSIGQSIDPSIGQSIDRSIDETAVVERPKGFYITRRLDRRLDEAVRYLQTKHGLKKVDRSILLNVLLDRDEVWREAAVDGLVDRIVDVLANRLIGRSIK